MTPMYEYDVTWTMAAGDWRRTFTLRIPATGEEAARAAAYGLADAVNEASGHVWKVTDDVTVSPGYRPGGTVPPDGFVRVADWLELADSGDIQVRRSDQPACNVAGCDHATPDECRIVRCATCGEPYDGTEPPARHNARAHMDLMARERREAHRAMRGGS